MTEAKNYAYFEGRFVPFEQANVSIMTSAFLYGTAVFEGLRAYWNEKQKQLYVFRLYEHFERMADSMKIMHMQIPYSTDELCAMTLELLRMNSPSCDVYIRPTAYKSGKKIGPTLDGNPTDFCMFTVPFGSYFPGDERGLKVCVSSWRRVEDNAIPARAKIVGAYANTALAKTDAVVAGFDECIVLTESGHVSEGSAMNLFMVKKGKLITTPIYENILEGITRATIMEFAREEFKLDTECREIDRSELYVADELFFCGTGAQIAPIASVDNRPVGDGKTGPISAKIRDYYESICRGEVSKYSKWLSPVFPQQGSAPAVCSKPSDKLEKQSS